MITIISGARDAGKTQRILALYHLTRCGDGLFMPKSFSPQGVFIGYEIGRLSSGESRPLARLSKWKPAGWDECSRCGRYSFSASGFAFAADVIADILEREVTPVYLDEIGPLELRGQGYAPLLKQILRTGRDLYLTVRGSLVREVSAAFGLQSATIVRLRKKNRTRSGS